MQAIYKTNDAMAFPHCSRWCKALSDHQLHCQGKSGGTLVDLIDSAATMEVIKEAMREGASEASGPMTEANTETLTEGTMEDASGSCAADAEAMREGASEACGPTTESNREILTGRTMEGALEGPAADAEPMTEAGPGGASEASAAAEVTVGSLHCREADVFGRPYKILDLAYGCSQPDKAQVRE